MRVLVTGAAGSIGRVVTTGLAASGHDVVGLDLVPPPDGTPFTWHVADRHGIDAVACRIGSFLEEPASVRGLSTWLSHGDCVRMVEAALTTPAPGYAVLYGISANTRAWWDLEPGRTLGYEPVDDGAAYADAVEDRPEDVAEAAHVGGDWAIVGGG